MPLRLFIVGDSISIEYGPHLQKMIEGPFAYDRKGGPGATLTDQFQAQGANGGDSALVLAYLKERRAVEPIAADVIAINCGLHDIKRDVATQAYQIPVEAYRENLRAIVQEVRATGAQLVWIRTTPVDDANHNSRSSQFHRFLADVNLYNAAADEIMREHRVPMIDLFHFTCHLGTGLFRDHVHYPEPIQKLQAAYIAGGLAAIVSAHSV